MSALPLGSVDALSTALPMESPTDRWRLPDGIDEWLPEQSRQLETLRRRFVDLGAAWGFEPVMPPLIEYLDALLTGTGEVMDLQTFKLTDQQDGRALGVRADMTPQVARIDAHALGREAPTRLLYTGSVLRARTDAVGGSRNPLQYGAELFGHAGVQSDLEVCRLMLESVLLSGIDERSLTLSLGHVGVYAGLVSEARLDPGAARRLHEAMVRGSEPDVRLLVEALADLPGSDAAQPDGDPTQQSGDPTQSGGDSTGEAVAAAIGGTSDARRTTALRALGSLPALRGGPAVLDEARCLLAPCGERAVQALATLSRMIDGIRASHPGVALHIDLGDLRGYRYHTGMLFSVHDAGGEQLARGGRYDAVGRAFGNARPATGFSGELARLMACGTLAPPVRSAILLRDPEADGAWQAVRELRAKGECVVSSLDGEAGGQTGREPARDAVRDTADTPIDRELVPSAAGWRVQPLSTLAR